MIFLITLFFPPLFFPKLFRVSTVKTLSPPQGLRTGPLSFWCLYLFPFPPARISPRSNWRYWLLCPPAKRTPTPPSQGFPPRNIVVSVTSLIFPLFGVFFFSPFYSVSFLDQFWFFFCLDVTTVLSKSHQLGMASSIWEMSSHGIKSPPVVWFVSPFCFDSWLAWGDRNFSSKFFPIQVIRVFPFGTRCLQGIECPGFCFFLHASCFFFFACLETLFPPPSSFSQ